MIPIVLIDDYPLAMNGIGAWLVSTGRFSILGTAGTLAEARELINTLPVMPRIIILDISLGPEDGLEFIPIVKEICQKKNISAPGILVCSMYGDPFIVKRAVDSGAGAYISKTDDSGEIFKAIDALLEGRTFFNSRYQISRAASGN